MRQAGRYLVEYRELRKKYDFLTFCHTPELIVQITKMPIEIFGFDAAIVFSDILLIAEELGFSLRFEEGSGPHITPELSSRADIQKLYGRKVHQPYLLEAIKELKKGLTVPLLGFAGAPFTVASYMIEGKSSKTLHKTKKWLFEDPKSFHELLTLLAGYTIQQLQDQIDAGVDAIQLFDTWAEKLAWPQFQEFSLHYQQMILQGLKNCPAILFCRGSSSYAPDLASIKPQGISLDWQCDLSQIRKTVGPNICLQGNLDPDILLTNPETVMREAKKILDKMKGDKGFIFNLGHGILPETPRENVEALVSCFRR
jgi:uroporphyrinogen decarboxylase